MDINGHVLELYARALQTAALLALPVVAVVALVGVVTALVQTLLGLQDQNLGFGPKLIAVGLMLVIWGMPGLLLLDALVRSVIFVLPRLAA